MNSEIQTIKQGDRNPVQNIQGIVDELNGIAQKKVDSKVKISWEIARDAVGPCLLAKITFEHPEDCLKFAKDVHELQQSADHHSNFTMDNFHSVNMMLSTHQPAPAITMVDVLFAHACMARL